MGRTAAAGRWGATILALAGLSACAGSGGKTITAVPAATAYAGPTAMATIAFTIPGRSTSASARRSPVYVSPASATLDVSATNGTSTISTPGLSLTNLCTTSGASRACTVSVPAPIGSDTFTLTLKDGSANVLSTKITSPPMTVAEGVANVVPPVILDPVAATIAATYGGSTPSSTAGVPVGLTFGDAAGMVIVPPGTYANASDVPLALTVTAIGSPSGNFSAAASCSPTSTMFSPWLTTAQLYFCPNGTQTLGSLYTLFIGSVNTTMAARRTNLATSSALPAEPYMGPGFTVALGISADDALSTFAETGFDIGTHALEIGSYSTTNSWMTCANSSYNYSVPLLSRSGSNVISAAEGFARLDQFTVGGSCTPSGLTLSTGADVVAMINDPGVTTTAYALATDDNTVDKLIAFNTATMAQSALTIPHCQPAGPYSFPHTLAVGPGRTLYVGCDNGTTLSAYATTPFTGTGSLVTTASSPYTYADVAANLDVAYAVAGGGAQQQRIYTIANGVATLAYTFASTSDVLSGSHALAVGNDDRLYLGLVNGGIYRVVAYDPYTNTLTDPAIVISTNLQTASPIELSVGQGGRIIVSGLRPDSEVGAAYWPN